MRRNYQCWLFGLCVTVYYNYILVSSVHYASWTQTSYFNVSEKIEAPPSALNPSTSNPPTSNPLTSNSLTSNSTSCEPLALGPFYRSSFNQTNIPIFNVNARSLTQVFNGNIPVIVSVPHGGSKRHPSFQWQRMNLNLREGAFQTLNSSDYTSRLSRISTDSFTIQLGQELRNQFQKLQMHPYLIMANFHRMFVDANRRMNHSLDCCRLHFPQCTAIADWDIYTPKAHYARLVYEEYHRNIHDAFTDIRRRFKDSPILFLDLHAQRAVTDELLNVTADEFLETVIVGTQDGKLVRNLTSMYEENGLFQLLKENMRVYPPSSHVAEHSKYNGGFIVAKSSRFGSNVDSIQLEFGYKLRSTAQSRVKVATALVRAIVEAYNITV